jgi:hypothetical protein
MEAYFAPKRPWTGTGLCSVRRQKTVALIPIHRIPDGGHSPESQYFSAMNQRHNSSVSASREPSCRVSTRVRPVPLCNVTIRKISSFIRLGSRISTEWILHDIQTATGSFSRRKQQDFHQPDNTVRSPFSEVAGTLSVCLSVCGGVAF